MGTMYEEEQRKYHRKNERLGSQEGEVKESQQNEMMVW